MAPRIGLQLYSVREALAEDFAGTLRQVAAMGYRDVETAFWPEGMTAAEAATALRDAGLNVVSAHLPLPDGDAAEVVFRDAEALGTPRVVWHGWPRDPRYDTLAGVRELANLFSEAGVAAKAHGFDFAIHNHWWENEATEGTIPYQFYLRECDPAVEFELDAYWAKVAGLDPAAVARDLRGRLPLLHLKDGPLSKEAPMSALGTGRLDIPAVLAAAGDEPGWVIVELDRVDGDMLAAVRQSRDYLIGLGLDGSASA